MCYTYAHMKIGVVGSGGLGSYFGGLLARTGHDVVFIARGEHLQALRARGLAVHSVHGDFTLDSVRATDWPEDVGAVDLVLFTVKTYDTDAAAELMRPLVDERTAILPLQNGVEAPERLSAFFDRAATLGGAAWVVSSVAAPGVIRQESQFRRIVLGELDGRDSLRVRAIRDTLAESGATAEVSLDIRAVLWMKLLFIASYSGIASVIRTTAGPLLADAGALAMLERAVREADTVARARGIALDVDAAEKTMAFILALAPNATPSMQRDVVAGRHLEYDALNGAVVRAGRAAGVPTPVHEFLWTCLRVIDSMAATAARQRREPAAQEGAR